MCAPFLNESVFRECPELIILTEGALGKVVLDVFLHMESALKLGLFLCHPLGVPFSDVILKFQFSSIVVDILIFLCQFRVSLELPFSGMNP